MYAKATMKIGVKKGVGRARFGQIDFFAFPVVQALKYATLFPEDLMKV